MYFWPQLFTKHGKHYPVDSDISSGKRHPSFEQPGPGELTEVWIIPKNKNQDFVNDGWSFLFKFLSHCKRLFSPFLEFARSLLEKLEQLDPIFYVAC